MKASNDAITLQIREKSIYDCNLFSKNEFRDQFYVDIANFIKNVKKRLVLLYLDMIILMFYLLIYGKH